MSPRNLRPHNITNIKHNIAMKKNLLLLLSGAFSLLFASALSAQTDFRFVKTAYVGALSADAAADWTKTWTNWDPKTANYPAPTDLTTLDGTATSLPVPGVKDITTTVTLDANKVYLLKGLVVVRSGGKLIIPAGTIIRAQADLSVTPKNYASIIVERGAQIEVLGTVNNPVIMTSTKAAGARDRGDWGGLVLAGRSSHNLLNGTTNDNVQIEGFNGISFDANIAKIGGTILDDNSGTIEYLRIEFGGLAFEANKEINGLTFGAVGSGTVVNHVQVSYSGDDSFEWFGGKVNSSYLIAFKGTDDDFDTDNGYGGKSQFGIGVRDSAYYDLSYAAATGASTSEGFESDNEATGTAAVKPYTNAIFSNYTMIGPVPVGSTWASMNSTTKAAFRRGARIRRNSSLRIANSIFMGYRNFLMVDGDSSLRNTNNPALLALVTPSTPVDAQTKQLYFTNNLIVNSTAAFNTAGDTVANGLVEVSRAKGSLAKLNALDAFVKQTGPLANCINTVAFSTGTVLVNPLASSTTPDFRPVAGSPALTCANFDDNPIFENLVPIQDVASALESPIFPNPISNGTLHFGRQVVSYGIFDVKGQLVNYGFDTDQVNINGFASGIYFIKLDGKVQKLIVE